MHAELTIVIRAFREEAAIGHVFRNLYPGYRWLLPIRWSP